MPIVARLVRPHGPPQDELSIRLAGGIIIAAALRAKGNTAMRDGIEDVRQNVCPICTLPVKLRGTTSTEKLLRCERCGDYDITLDALVIIGEVANDDRPKLSGWISDQNLNAVVPRVTPEVVRDVAARPHLKFSERAKRLLIYFADNTSKYGEQFRIWLPAIEARLQLFDHEQIEYLALHLARQGWLHEISGGRHDVFMLTGEGAIKAEEWQQTERKSVQGFVAMWFDPSMDAVWLDGLEPAIREAGYRALRIDLKEHNNKICDELIVEIRRSRFVVADFTNHRGGVYYEAGYATGFGLPVLFTCNKDHGTQLHFDVRQYNCIIWETPDDLRTKLRTRISATIGDGPLRN